MQQMIILVLFFPLLTAANDGILLELSDPIPTSGNGSIVWDCLKTQLRLSGLIVVMGNSVYTSISDAQAAFTARKSGISSIGILMDPVVGLGTPKLLYDSVFVYLDYYGAKVDRIWINIYGSGRWSKDPSVNIASVHAIVAEGQKRGYVVGLKIDQGLLEDIFANTKEFSNLPLWYTNDHDYSNFKDFTPFGGWTKPTMKTYHTGWESCGITLTGSIYYE